MYEYEADVLRVVDGDTIDVIIDLGFGISYGSEKMPIRVRLFGIDAPESRTKDLEEKKRGKAASAFLEDKVEGKEIILRTHLDKHDSFGRILGEVILDDDNINGLMILEGHAVEYRKR